MSIQRYRTPDTSLRDSDLMRPYGREGRSVEVVTYADHLAEKAIAYADGRVDGMKDVADLCYDRGVQAERERIVEAVNGLGVVLVDSRFAPEDNSRYAQAVILKEAITAIEGSKP